MFGANEIENLRKVYNSEHPHEKKIMDGTPEEVWNNLKQRFHSKCRLGKSECIISHLMTKPKSPTSWLTNPTEWLSSTDIDAVETQYEKLFPNYKFLGCIPIDFDLKSKTGKCLVDVLCSIKIKDLYDKGTKQIGIVFNTDVHTGKGQHWIGLYCDLNPDLVAPRVTYFDSYSQKPEREIRRLMKRWRDEWTQTHIHRKTMLTTYNKTRHQYKDTECGMYCLYFHYSCLLEIPMDEKIPDEVMENFRDLLFKRH
jgi:hypothetical protein